MSIIVRCVRGSGDKEAPPISDSLIVTENMAAKRGKRFLDDPSQGGYYTAKNRNLKVPHKVKGHHLSESVVPGKWVQVTSGHLNLSNQKLRVKSYKLTITPFDIWGEAETQQFVEMGT